jgi:ATP-dependent DNA helicase RecG
LKQITEEAPIKLGKSSQKIIRLMYENKNVTIPEMAKKIGITERGIEKNIKKLRENKIVERIDGERGGFWEITILD